MGRTRVEKEAAELNRRILYCETYKKKLLDYVQQIKDKCINREITYSEYESLLNQKTQGKTIQEWLDYYDSYTEDCKKRIKQSKRKSKTKKVLTIFFFFTLISVLIFSFFYLRPIIIGLTIKETQTHTQTLNLELSESTDYEWQLEHLGQLQSARISGLIEGEGSAKVYLDDLLILDSSNLKSEKIKSTGNAITGLSIKKAEEKSIFSSLIGFSVKIFSTITGKTPSETNEEPVSESTPKSESNTSSPKESYSEVTQETQKEAPQETSPSQEQEEPLSSERSEEPVGSSETEEKAKKTGELTEGEQKPSEGEQEKIPEATEEETKQKEIIVKQFTDICEQTCALSDLSLNKSSYTLKIQISNAKLSLEKIKYEIIPTAEVPREEIPQEAPEENITNITAPENITIENITEIVAETNITNITTLQYTAVIGKPVKWKKHIELEKPGIIKINLPKEAENITVNKIVETYSQPSYSEIQEEAPQETSPSQEQEEPLSSERSEEPVGSSETEEKEDLENLTTENITEVPEVIENIPIEKQKETEEVVKKEKAKASITGGITGGITGEVIEEQDKEKSIFKSIIQSIPNFFKKIFSALMGKAITTEETSESKWTSLASEEKEEIEVTIEDTALEYEIEYETPAPEAFEEETAKGKRITISGPENIHYENVLAFTDLPKETPQEKIKLYHLINETTNEKEAVEFTSYDKNNNSLIDYVEWFIPSLNNETYELIIEISKAEHLDENRSFINDIYEQVKALDDVWSEPIPDGHYVRVTFEKNLTNKNDITIYARANSSNESYAKIEVYRENETNLIAKFEDIGEESWYKVWLTNLSEEENYDVFDLKILGSVEFDYIVDPAVTIVPSPTTAVSSNGTLYENTNPASNSYNITTNGAISSACEAQINVSDNNACTCLPAGNATDDAYFLLNFTIPQYTTLYSVNITAEANNTAGVDNITLAVYNYSATGVNKWLTVDSTATVRMIRGTEFVLTYNITDASSLANFVFNNQVTVLVSTVGGSADNLMMDYVGIDVNYVSEDTTPPAVSILYPTATSYSLVVSELNYSINEFGGDCWYSTDGGATNSTLATAGNNFTSVDSIEGSNIWNLYCNDTVGNENYTESVTFTQDTSYPQFNNYWDNNASLVGSGTASFNATILNTNGSVVLEINNTNYTASNLTDDYMFNVSVDFNINATWSYFWSSWSNFSLNYNVSETFYYTINNTDTTAPSVTIDYPLNNSNFSVTSVDINYTANDETALDKCWWTKDFGNTNTSLTCGDNVTGQTWIEGENIITIYANDSSANQGSSSVTFIVDTIPPKLTIEHPSAYNYSQTTMDFNITIIDNSTIDTCWLTLNDGINNETMTSFNATYYNFTNSSINDGIYTVKFYCNDSLDNANNTESVVFGIDKTVPTMTIVFPESETYNINVTELNYTWSETAPDSCWYSTGNGATNSTPVTVGTNFTSVISSEGSNNWTLWCNDTINNEGTASVVFGKDTVYPLLTIEHPANTTYNINTIDFNITGNGDMGFCNFSVDNWATTYEMTAFNVTLFNATLSGISDNQYTAKFNCNDTSSNINDTEQVTFIIDANAPSLSGENVNDTDLETNDYFCVNITATDTVGINTVLAEIWNTTTFVNYTMSDTAAVACDGASGDNIYGAEIQAIAAGEWNYSAAYSNDTAGNLQIYDFTDLNISIVTSNTAPEITFVSPIPNTDPAEGSSVLINFNFTVYDDNGVSDINNASVNANFTKTGEELRENLTCAAIPGEVTDDDKEQNFTCEIEMWYWDENGNWNITVYAEDNSATFAINDSTFFQYNILYSIEISPQEFSFNAVIGAENQTASNDPTFVNNTGNYNATGKMQVEAINLYGSNGEFIAVENLTIDIDTGGDGCSDDACTECDGTLLSNGTFQTITGAVLERGNLSVAGALSQEQVYYCIRKVPSTISSQTYSTQNSGSSAWTIKIVTSIVFIYAPQLKNKQKKRKKKKKTLEEDNLIISLNLITKELREQYSADKEKIIKLLTNEIKKKYRLNNNELSKLIKVKERIEIPINIFSKELGALEAISRYMKENLNLSYREIAEILNRNERTIWTAYNKAKEKQPEPIKIEKIKETKIFLPISIFKNKLTILESVIIYLKQQKLKYNEIAKLLNRDQRNIWTIYSRAVKKIKRKI